MIPIEYHGNQLHMVIDVLNNKSSEYPDNLYKDEGLCHCCHDENCVNKHNISNNVTFTV